MANMPTILISRGYVQSLTGFSRSTIYNKLADSGKYSDTSFPKPISIGSSRRWIKQEVINWIDLKTIASRASSMQEATAHHSKNTSQCLPDLTVATYSTINSNEGNKK
jgi:prophage regulatory protein